MSEPKSIIEREASALVSLCKARVEHRRSRGPGKMIVMTAGELLSGPDMTLYEMNIEKAVRDPIEVGLHAAIRLIGEEAYKRGGLDEMLSVAYSAEDMAGKFSSILCSILAHRWDGIGGVWHA